MGDGASRTKVAVNLEFVGESEPTGGESTRTFRVTVRGQFADLTPKAKAFLERHVDEHDMFRARFTTEGTFTYDRALKFFNLRYEVREVETGESSARAVERALFEAEMFLSTMQIGFSRLRAAVMDMSAMTER